MPNMGDSHAQAVQLPVQQVATGERHHTYAVVVALPVRKTSPKLPRWTRLMGSQRQRRLPPLPPWPTRGGDCRLCSAQRLLASRAAAWKWQGSRSTRPA